MMQAWHALVALAALLASIVHPASAALEPLSPIPAAIGFSAAVGNATEVLLFGGTSGVGDYREEVLRYDVSVGAFVPHAHRLPNGTMAGSAVFVPPSVLLLTGFTANFNQANPNSTSPGLTQAYFLESGGVATRRAIYPARAGAAYLYDWERMLIVGGWTSAGPTSKILSKATFTPWSDLPTPWSFGGHAKVDRTAYLFGGWDGARELDTIIQVNPNGTSLLLPQRLPFARSNATAASDGTSVYIFGGEAGGVPTSQILKFTPGYGVETLCDRLPTPRTGAAAHAIGPGTVLVFGGRDARGYLNSTLKFQNVPCPDPPHLWLDATWKACGNVVSLQGQSDGEPPVQWSWDFHDGSSGTGQTPSHEFAAPGTFQVSLVAVDDRGRSASLIVPVTVPGPPCPSAPPSPGSPGQAGRPADPATSGGPPVTAPSVGATTGSSRGSSGTKGTGTGSSTSPGPAGSEPEAPRGTPGVGVALAIGLVMLAVARSRVWSR